MVFGRVRSFFSLFFHMTRITFQISYGYWRISKLEQPIVSIFGSARIAEDQIYFQQAHDLTHRFVDNDISVLAGGGPGIMSAVSCGAVEHGNMPERGRSIGIAFVIFPTLF